MTEAVAHRTTSLAEGLQTPPHGKHVVVFVLGWASLRNLLNCRADIVSSQDRVEGFEEGPLVLFAGRGYFYAHKL